MLLKQLFPLFIPVLWAADGAGNGGGGDASGDDNGDNNTSTGGGQAPGDDASTGGANNESGDDQTFTQADLNRVASKTRREALTKFAKDLGLETVKDLESIVKDKQAADDKAKSELDKANEAKDAAEQKAQAAEQRAANALMRAAFDRAGADVEDLDLAWLAAKDLGLFNGDGDVEVNLETGAVSGMDKVIKKVLEKKPTLKKVSRGQAGGTDGSEGSSDTPSEPTDDEKAAYKRRFGIRN